jgi:hypothetical protein
MVESRKQRRPLTLTGASAREACYFYFLSLSKGQKRRNGVTAAGPPQRRCGSLVSKSKARKSTKSSGHRPSWDVSSAAP